MSLFTREPRAFDRSRHPVTPRCLVVSLLLLGSALPWTAAPTAWATNGEKPRVPVKWINSGECIATFDKAQRSSTHLQYNFEGPDDVMPPESMDELPDSRKHQFFAFCRHQHRQELLPRWITAQDHQRALQFGMDTGVSGNDFILEQHPQWAGCVHRINADDARLPITHAQARQGVAWNFAALPTGSYVLQAYTWEPPENIWTNPPRPGVVRVWDSRKESLPPPALSFDESNLIGYKNQTLQIQGCLASAPNSTWSVDYAPLPAAGQPVHWTPLQGPTPVTTPTFRLDFIAPPDKLAGPSTKFMLRATITDPQGRSYIGYSRGDLIVLGIDAPDDLGPSPGQFDPRSDNEGEGCALSPRPSRIEFLFGVFAILGLQRRRKKRAAPSSR